MRRLLLRLLLASLAAFMARHPYLTGNFAPVHGSTPLTRCTVDGEIPPDFAGGQYVRNGASPLVNDDAGRAAHWFDGDGALTGVLFRRSPDGITPEFVHQPVLTDLYISQATTAFLQRPLLVSVATLINPAISLLRVGLAVLRSLVLVFLSHLPGSLQAIKRISAANTSVFFHDGRALAGCESGPYMRVTLPDLATVGWFDGVRVAGEPQLSRPPRQLPGFGGTGPMGWMKEWTTAHPRVDPLTKELLCYHSNFIHPFVHYSIIPTTWRGEKGAVPRRLISAPVPGVTGSKMMHDFGVSSRHTVIIDLPLSLDPRNLLQRKPVISYDLHGRTRFGVFPRWHPEQVRWFETNPCCIFHTANTWDEMRVDPETGEEKTVAVNMLVCRLTSAAIVYSSGNLVAPQPIPPPGLDMEEDQCRLYYYRFSLEHPTKNIITHQFALTSIPCEFPSLRDSASMGSARYIYGCSVAGKSFGTSLGSTHINSILKVDVHALIARGKASPPTPITGCVDTRSADSILAAAAAAAAAKTNGCTYSDTSAEPEPDPIQIFKLPPNHYAQESRFVPRRAGTTEDDGWLVTYVFDETQLDEAGDAPSSAASELWIVDARSMRDVVARVRLPQRVPYGLHGCWFPEDEVLGQRPVGAVRKMPERKAVVGARSVGEQAWAVLRGVVVKAIG